MPHHPERITTPEPGSGPGLIYIDPRCRRKGFDLTLGSVSFDYWGIRAPWRFGFHDVGNPWAFWLDVGPFSVSKWKVSA